MFCWAAIKSCALGPVGCVVYDGVICAPERNRASYSFEGRKEGKEWRPQLVLPHTSQPFPPGAGYLSWADELANWERLANPSSVSLRMNSRLSWGLASCKEEPSLHLNVWHPRRNYFWNLGQCYMDRARWVEECSYVAGVLYSFMFCTEHSSPKSVL